MSVTDWVQQSEVNTNLYAGNVATNVGKEEDEKGKVL